jgi:hypothetical protein
MSDSGFRLDFQTCRQTLRQRLAEPAPGRIQLLAGPRQVGKTTILLEIEGDLGDRAVYAAADAPDAALPGFWERLLARVEEAAAAHGTAILLLDEAHLLHDWAARLKGVWDRFRRYKTPVHVVATGSSALHLAVGSRESLAGRFERLTLTHWSALSVATAFGVSKEEAAELVVRLGSYPGAVPLRGDLPRWAAYVRDAIIEPAIGRDILALASVRRPALLRQVFGVATSSPAQIVSLQKIQGQLQDAGALETIAHYIALSRGDRATGRSRPSASAPSSRTPAWRTHGTQARRSPTGGRSHWRSTASSKAAGDSGPSKSRPAVSSRATSAGCSSSRGGTASSGRSSSARQDTNRRPSAPGRRR